MPLDSRNNFDILSQFKVFHSKLTLEYSSLNIHLPKESMRPIDLIRCTIINNKRIILCCIAVLATSEYNTNSSTGLPTAMELDLMIRTGKMYEVFLTIQCLLYLLHNTSEHVTNNWYSKCCITII